MIPRFLLAEKLLMITKIPCYSINEMNVEKRTRNGKTLLKGGDLVSRAVTASLNYFGEERCLHMLSLVNYLEICFLITIQSYE